MKGQKAIAVLVLWFFFHIPMFAQDYYIKTITSPNTYSDNGAAILATDTEYIIRNSCLFPFNGLLSGMGVFKTDLHGDQIWESSFNFEPFGASGRGNIVRLPNENYMISGGTIATGMLYQDLFSFINNDGMFYRYVIHGDTMDNRAPTSVLRDDKIIVYTSIKPPGYNLSQVNNTLLLTLDTTGTILREDTLQNIAGFPMNGAEDLLLLPTQEYILGIGAQNEPDKIYGYLRKTDTIGNTIWEQAINDVYMGVANMHLASLKNGNFVVSWGVKLGGATQDRGSFFVRCYNAEGDSLWQYTFASVDYIRNIQDLYVCANGDIIGCGYTLEAYPEYLTGWIFRLSPQGELFWSREFVYWEALGHYMPLYAVTEDPYGDIVATGYANRPDPETGFWKGQAVLLKVNAMGCFGEGGCTDTAIVHSVVTGMDTPPPQAGSSVAVSPVKVTWLGYGELAVFYNLPATPAATLHLYDIQGRPITNQPLPPYDIFTPLQTPPLPPGVYLYAAEQGGMIVARGKVAVMR